ncbi:MAG: DUF4197 domain-containing protein [Bacteroidota bacterium]
MKKHPLLLFVIFIGLFSQEIKAQFFDDVLKAISPVQGGLTETDAVAGIREALIKGTGESVTLVSNLNGYFGNPEIKIPFPREARTIESKLRAIGLGSQVDEVVLSINRAAEDAAKEAGTIFAEAIRNMTISDAIQIVKGNSDAATRYLERTTSPALKVKFLPVIKNSLDKVDATRLWTGVISTYNQIPFVSRMDPDLAGYVTDKAIAGLFIMIAKEELKIRKDPVARSTELLKKVFGGT